MCNDLEPKVPVTRNVSFLLGQHPGSKSPCAVITPFFPAFPHLSKSLKEEKHSSLVTLGLSSIYRGKKHLENCFVVMA